MMMWSWFPFHFFSSLITPYSSLHNSASLRVLCGSIVSAVQLSLSAPSIGYFATGLETRFFIAKLLGLASVGTA